MWCDILPNYILGDKEKKITYTPEMGKSITHTPNFKKSISCTPWHGAELAISYLLMMWPN